MSNLHKSNWLVSEDHVTLSVPFAKVDKEKRQVSGFATLDNLDQQGDVVLAEASTKAFARARGNLREMHQPIAAGHLVDFVEQEFYDHETSKFYRGIFVTAYVSKGAPATWEKVLDGTLTGFSIGGEIKEASSEFVKDADMTVRFIKDYNLIELSLVDNPANPLANVFSFQKSAEGSVTLKGMVADTVVENIFRCASDGKVLTGAVEAVECPFCGDAMENIGWVETGPDKADKVREAVSSYINKSDDSHIHFEVPREKTEGGVTVEKNEEAKEGEAVAGVDEVTEEKPTEEGTLGAEAADGTEEPAVAEEGEVVAGVDEVPNESEEVQKKMDELVNTIEKSLQTTREEANSAVTALEEKIDGLTKSIETRLSDFEKKFEGLDTDLAAAKGLVADLEKNLDKVNSAAAFKKSGEVEKAAPEKVQKDDDWAGAFSVTNLFK